MAQVHAARASRVCADRARGEEEPGQRHMFTVTEPALERLSPRLARKGAADGRALRFTRREVGWNLRQDGAHLDDTAFAHQGRIVLLLDAAVAKAMAALTLGASSTETRAALKLRQITRGSK